MCWERLWVKRETGYFEVYRTAIISSNHCNFAAEIILRLDKRRSIDVSRAAAQLWDCDGPLIVNHNGFQCQLSIKFNDLHNGGCAMFVNNVGRLISSERFEDILEVYEECNQIRIPRSFQAASSLSEERKSRADAFYTIYRLTHFSPLSLQFKPLYIAVQILLQL